MKKQWQVPKHTISEFAPKRNTYCVCIHIINEGDRFKKQLAGMNPLTKHADILILDGGSTDGSTDKKFLKSHGVRTLLVKNDTGKLSAQLRMGYAYALDQGYQGIISIDGNGKDSYKDIPKFIKMLDEGYDYVQGSRFIPGGKAVNTPLMRYIAVRLIHAPILSLAARYWYTDTTNAFRAYSRKYLLDKRVQPFRNVFQLYELLAYLTVRANQLGFKTIEIPVTRSYPAKGKTPTKISHFRGNLILLQAIIWTLLGKYNPA